MTSAHGPAVDHDGPTRRVDGVPEAPAAYRSWSAAAKRAWIWHELIEPTEYDPVERPDLVMQPPWVMLSIAGRPDVLERTLDRVDDQMEADRPKIIHPVGATALVQFEITEGTFTGVLGPGTTSGLVRISLAAPATGNKSITPGMGLKLFVDGAASLDLLAMNHTVGQGRDFNLFSNTFTHDLTDEHSELRPPQRLMKALFERVTSEPRRLTIDHFAAVTSTGSVVAEPRRPDRLVFRPHAEVHDTFAGAQGQDFRDPLCRIPTGTSLWHIDAVVGTSVTAIGTITTTSPFVCSRGGDRLFFRHHIDPSHRRSGGFLRRWLDR